MKDNPDLPAITVTYRGENGDGWVPTSHRDLWNYAVRTGQVVVPPLADGGAEVPGPMNTGDTFEVTFIPPEYAGRLEPAPPTPQPVHFTLTEDTDV